jgi:uncharacterized damage-inducible protein DinB
MFTLDGIRQFHAWTHQSLTVLLDHLEILSPEDYAKELSGFGHLSVRGQVAHILNCEAFWIHTLQGRLYIDREPSTLPAVSDARAMRKEITRQTIDYLSPLTDQQLNSSTTLHFPESETAVRTPALILHHMLTHAFHHKGQIVAMCRILGHPAPDTDLNNFE